MGEFVGLVFKSCSALRPGALGERADLGAVDNEGMAVTAVPGKWYRTSSWTPQLWCVGEVCLD